MRLGVISDVHANQPALRAVLSFFKTRSIESIIHAGDVVGYNSFPNGVIEDFIANKVRSIAGNHDRALASRANKSYPHKTDLSWFNQEAAFAVLWTKKALTQDNLEYIIGLGTRERFDVDRKTVTVVHGSPNDDDRYVFEEDVTDVFFEHAGADILVMGHTHVPFIRRIDKRLAINPGSVGQPRDHDPRASCAIIDISAMDAEIHRVEYDIETTQKANIKAGLPERFAKRLANGW